LVIKPERVGAVEPQALVPPGTLASHWQNNGFPRLLPAIPCLKARLALVIQGALNLKIALGYYWKFLGYSWKVQGYYWKVQGILLEVPGIFLEVPGIALVYT
jgi:hypothetical protein